MTTIAQESQGHGEHDHDHPKFLAHHFDTPQQQFDSGKLGIWLFLTTEILLFSGLFCAYAVYRSSHPEVFEFAHLYLYKSLGTLNTLILIFSSFTMAWGVRAAQTGERKLCVTLLAITMACGAGFLCVKAVEWTIDFHDIVLPGPYYNPSETPVKVAGEGATGMSPTTVQAVPEVHGPTVDTDAPAIAKSNQGYFIEQSKVARASAGPSGLNPRWENTEQAMRQDKSTVVTGHEIGNEPYNAQIFFSLYFLMTGLHGLHVIAGMCCIFWVMRRAKRGDFSPEYYSPVDFVGLYWHVVDLVWIFLFPLLYLIS